MRSWRKLYLGTPVWPHERVRLIDQDRSRRKLLCLGRILGPPILCEHHGRQADTGRSSPVDTDFRPPKECRSYPKGRCGFEEKLLRGWNFLVTNGHVWQHRPDERFKCW